LSLVLPPASSALTNGLALTPPMGWNSWNHFGCNVSDATIRAMADSMATTGMKAAGYQFINIDDCWQVSRDANGVIVPDPVRFPYGMKALADYVHSKGLKLGVYSDHGVATCGGRPGGYGYEYLDANTYASWGVDYLKYDNCNLPSSDVPQADYSRMADALIQSGRRITFSICAWSFVSWMPSSGNLWRTTGDINDSFSSMLSNLNGNKPPAFLAGPGRWNDPDMLEVGNGGMSFTEDQAHFSLWCIVGAPLIAGNDLSTVSPQTLAILTNTELIAVDQDPAGEQGVQLPNTGTNQIWVRPLGTDFSTKAVALFNPNTSASSLTVNWTDIGLRAGSATVRDLWAKADLGVFYNSFATNVPAHGVVVLKVVGAPPLLPAVGTNHVTDLQPAYSYVGWGTMVNNQSIGGNVLRLNGTSYAKGLGAHAFSGVEYRLGGIAARFQSDIGVDDEVGANGSVVFHVIADGTTIYVSGVMRGGAPHQTLDLDVTGVNRLTLGVSDADDGINYDHADWAGAQLIVSSTVPASPPVPTGLVAASGLPIAVSWNPTRSAASYNLKRGPASVGPFTNYASVALPFYSDTNISAGGTYYYAVSAVNSFGESSNSAPAPALACMPPATPSGVAAVAGRQQVTLQWNAVPGAAGYDVARAVSSTPYSFVAYGLTTTNFTDLSVANGTSYSYVVYADNGCSRSSRSAFVVATPNLPPAAPSGLAATTAGPRALLQWNATGTASGYIVKRSNSSAGPFATVASNISDLFYLDTGLTVGLVYYYVVSAVNSVGESPDSSPVTVSPCSATLPVGWSDQDIGSVGFAGSATSCGSSFIIQGSGADIWNTADAFNFAAAALSGDSTLVTRVNFLSNTDPWAKAGVMFRDNNSASSAFVDMIVSAASGVSLQWRGTAGGGCNALNVSGVAAPAWVKLVRSGSSFAGYYSLDGTAWTQAGTASVTMSAGPLAGLAVTAHNNAALCVAGFDYASSAAPATPTGLSATSSFKQVAVAWNPCAGAVSYILRRALAAAGPYTNGLNVWVTSIADTNVTNGTTYFYEVAAVNPIGQSSYSSPAPVSVPIPVITAALTNNNNLLLSWPVTASSFALWSTTNLLTPATWNLVTNASFSIGDPISTTITQDAVVRFYRLEGN
jgi:alpha-galactosidase